MGKKNNCTKEKAYKQIIDLPEIAASINKYKNSSQKLFLILVKIHLKVRIIISLKSYNKVNFMIVSGIFLC